MKTGLPFKIVLICVLIVIASCDSKVSNDFNMSQIYPWCIVAYDTPERTPEERVELLKEFGFSKYAYDWRDRHLNDTKKELELALDNDIEVISVWLWLNAKRDSLHKLSPANEKVLKIVEELGLKTTFWLSMSGNFFEDRTDEESLKYAIEMVDAVQQKAAEMDCEIALYNHSGWFGNPYNEIKIINALPNANLSMVYNFHHGRDHMDTFDALVQKMSPYLSAVNLNGMEKDGEKIMTIGAGSREGEMIDILINNGFNGPWGILGHVEDVDVKTILEENLNGLKNINKQ